MAWPRIVTELARLPWRGLRKVRRPRPEVLAAPPPALLHRRRLLFGAAAAAAAAAAGAAWWLGSSGLPEPAGQAVGPEYLAATLKVKPAPRVPMPPDHATWSTCVAGAPVKGLADLDLVLAIDTTGSMGGVINDVKANVAQLIATLRAGGGTVRVGIVAYRDSPTLMWCARSP